MVSKFKQQAKPSPTKTIKKRSVAIKGGGHAAWLYVQQRTKTGKRKKYSTWKMNGKDGGVAFFQQYTALPPDPTSL